MKYLHKIGFWLAGLGLCLLLSFWLAPPNAHAEGENLEDLGKNQWSIGGIVTYDFSFGQRFNIQELETSKLINNGAGFDFYFRRTAPAFGDIHITAGIGMGYAFYFGSTIASWVENNNTLLQANIAENHGLQFCGILGIELPMGLILAAEGGVGPTWLTIQYTDVNASNAPELIRGNGVTGKVGLGVYFSPVQFGLTRLVTKLGVYYGFGDNVPLLQGIEDMQNQTLWGIHGGSLAVTAGVGFEL